MLNASTHLNQIFQYVLSRHLTRFDEHNADGDKQIPLEKRVKKRKRGNGEGAPSWLTIEERCCPRIGRVRRDLSLPSRVVCRRVGRVRDDEVRRTLACLRDNERRKIVKGGPPFDFRAYRVRSSSSGRASTFAVR